MTTVEQALDEQLFLDWLATKGDDDAVGMAWVSGACPVANYLRDVTRLEVTVHPDATSGEGEYHVLNQPFMRLSAFFNQVAVRVDKGRSVFTPVTRSQVDAIVREVRHVG